MKKTYVKPEVMLVRFELSEAIASCGTLLYNNYTEECGYTTDMQYIIDTFGVTLTPDGNCSIPLDGYCYFTSNDSGQLLMNS